MALELTIDRLLEMRGKPVYDRDGEKIGVIEDVYIDDRTDEPEWLGLGTGFLGMKHAVVPLANAGIRDGRVEVPYSKGDVKAAPPVGDDEDISPTQEMELSRHYALQAEPSSPASASTTDTMDPTVTPSTDGEMRDQQGHLHKPTQQ